MKRYGQVIRVKPERYEEYREYHRNVWPEIIELGSQCNIRNQTIFHRDGLLFRYFEYTGDDYEADMAAAAVQPQEPGVVGAHAADAGTARELC